MKDVAIVGAGPVGICLARALAGAGMDVALIERARQDQLSTPQPDGREIAVTRASAGLLETLGVWQRIPQQQVYPLASARIFNGASQFSMKVDPHDPDHPLGVMVSNHLIRQAAYDEASRIDGIEWHFSSLKQIDTDAQCARLRLETGEEVTARLAVAADSRFSETRRQMGIAARMRDNGRSMMVCRVHHERAHDQSAWEWFDHGQTLALLPLTSHLSSAVVTLPSRQMAELSSLPSAALSAALTQRYANRLGAMTVDGEAHVYPLVSAYAERFVGTRLALVGDAAVGMHPVTAHGFNFGIHSQYRLARRLIDAYQQGKDIAAPHLLVGYEREHRLATWPLYQATQAIVGLYTDERPHARILRHLGLRAGERLSPARHWLAQQLAQTAPNRAGPIPLPGLPSLPLPPAPFPSLLFSGAPSRQQ
ncbi:5-demethoxyubiquinol-8 5-hydroxylase UbiM [Halomonas sp. DP8Y7-3]|uniref:5-demethoxyubiquinol-8 5-hydroxylase UbiM n=1 Tax=Halomonas sp. DP8Y7-3 TaxID=2859079 RepID=UPI001C95E3A8|nr:5-demethoxyubiquinol-8 5-hydroxylase UbiM [Halomonas sp. DP8Y7-3]MBY5927568.1 5-demethoxyubiquinol-8 5-hydroxylase UbiM [Halomonas sp. DP8Y7-3]